MKQHVKRRSIIGTSAGFLFMGITKSGSAQTQNLDDKYLQKRREQIDQGVAHANHKSLVELLANGIDEDTKFCTVGVIGQCLLNGHLVDGIFLDEFSQKNGISLNGIRFLLMRLPLPDISGLAGKVCVVWGFMRAYSPQWYARDFNRAMDVIAIQPFQR